MPNLASKNRSMFRRLVRRLLFANRGRLFVVLLALSAGAAVSAALLNLQVDAKRRITSEFRSFGANILVLPRSSGASLDGRMPETTELQLRSPLDARLSVHSGMFLYAIADAAPNVPLKFSPVVVVGYSGYLPGSAPLDSLLRGAELQMGKTGSVVGATCIVGQTMAARLNVHFGNQVFLRNGDRQMACVLTDILKTGDAEDSQIFLSLSNVQQLSNAPGRISVIQINAFGSSKEIEQYAMQLHKDLPDADVRPLRQFTEGQAKIYSRISGLLTAATAIILILTALCVMAAMTNIAAERKPDVGMMKAIGGSARGILNLFLTEAVLLGLFGGLIGAAAGIALSMALGKAVFGVAALPRLIVYPISVTLTIIVAILGAYPLRRLANVRPATIFRGEV